LNSYYRISDYDWGMRHAVIFWWLWKLPIPVLNAIFLSMNIVPNEARAVSHQNKAALKI